jgi:hypothetical protein
MSEPQIAELRRTLANMGLSDTTITHPTTTLEDLFMRIIRENTGNNNGQPVIYTGSPESR